MTAGPWVDLAKIAAVAIVLTAMLYGLGSLVYSQLPLDVLDIFGDREPSVAGEEPVSERPLSDRFASERAPREDGAGEPKPIHIGEAEGDFTRPVRTYTVEPAYTNNARKARIEGKVTLRLTIDEQGEVREDVEVLKGLEMGLTEAAVVALKQWRFEPALLDGQPVAVHWTMTVNFRLE
ncbi:MAG: energy transducer TonB [Acidobacteria bacterium]|nr:energy transducer TonB [Acidobacteriota bacterium]